MQYKKQKKTSWWIILLCIPLLFGCSPLAQLWTIGVYLGNHLIITGEGLAIEKIIEILIHKLFNPSHDVTVDVGTVDVDADNPLRGTYSGDLKFDGVTANCQYSYTLKKPRMVRRSIDAIWKPISEAKEKINKSFQENC